MNKQMILEKVALWFRKNHVNEREKYPQLWYCMPHGKTLRKICQWICGTFGGHEISRSEWGYGGGKFVDHNCRWCDAVIRVPIKESPPPSPELEDLSGEIGMKN